MARKARSSPFWPTCMTRSTRDVKKATQELFVVHRFSMCGWFRTFFIKKVGPFVHYKVTARVPRKERQIGTNSCLAWKGHQLMGSLARRKEEPGFYPCVKDFQMFPWWEQGVVLIIISSLSQDNLATPWEEHSEESITPFIARGFSDPNVRVL